jgi:mRNA interferase HigB
MPYKLPVRIIALRTLRIFGDRHPEARSSLKAWRTAVEAASFQNMNEVIAAFSKAKMITGLRARFEVAGGNYRLIASFNFRRQEVFVKFLGTHAEYDAVDAATVSQF